VGVHGDLILCSIINQTLIVREEHIGWCCMVALVVDDDLHTTILPDTDRTEKRKRVQSQNIRARVPQVKTLMSKW